MLNKQINLQKTAVIMYMIGFWVMVGLSAYRGLRINELEKELEIMSRVSLAQARTIHEGCK
jgi:hypothetical protein